MTKSEQREVNLCRRYVAAGHSDIAARGLASCVRAARTLKSAQELMAEARALGLSIDQYGNAMTGEALINPINNKAV
jgi:hypothetical protein